MIKIQKSLLMVILLLSTITFSATIGYSQSGSTTLSIIGDVTKESQLTELLKRHDVDIKDSEAYNVKITLRNI